MPSAAEEVSSAVSQEVRSSQAPPKKEVAPVPKFGDKAPVSEKLSFRHDKPTVIVFLRHCGCPCTSCTFAYPVIKYI